MSDDLARIGAWKATGIVLAAALTAWLIWAASGVTVDASNATAPEAAPVRTTANTSVVRHIAAPGAKTRQHYRQVRPRPTTPRAAPSTHVCRTLNGVPLRVSRDIRCLKPRSGVLGLTQRLKNRRPPPVPTTARPAAPLPAAGGTTPSTTTPASPAKPPAGGSTGGAAAPTAAGGSAQPTTGPRK